MNKTLLPLLAVVLTVGSPGTVGAQDPGRALGSIFNSMIRPAQPQAPALGNLLAPATGGSRRAPICHGPSACWTTRASTPSPHRVAMCS